MNKQKIDPPMISVSHIQSREELDKFIHALLTRVIYNLVCTQNSQSWQGPLANKTCFYITGACPIVEENIRKLVDHYRNEFPGYIIRLTKRAHFDAMITVTITRRIDSNPRYMTIMG